VLLVTLLLALYFIQNVYYSTAFSTVHSGVINGLQLSLTLGAKTTTYRQGADINMTLALTNVSHQALNVSFDAPNSYFSFDARDHNNSLAFSADDYGKFTGNITLAPERSINETFNWETGYRNMQVPVGEYQITGFFVIKPNSASGFQTSPLKITIVKSSSPTPLPI
jgi:hypothetical protein